MQTTVHLPAFGAVGRLALAGLLCAVALVACGGSGSSSDGGGGLPPAGQAPSRASVSPSQSVTAGQPARFFAGADVSPIAWQWQRNGLDIPGATDSSFSLPIAQPADSGSEFRVRAANSAGAVLSDPARLTVLPARAGSLSLLAGSVAGKGNLDGTGAAARFDFPSDVALDAAGNVYVADTFNNAIRKVTPGGVVTTLVREITQPQSHAFDAAGNLVVVTGGRFPQLLRIAPSGAVATVISAFSFGFGRAVAIDAAGNYLIAYSTSIIKVTPEGSSTTLAGGNISGAADGVGVAASFGRISATAIAPSGTLYVADEGNNAIRKVTPDGAVTTLVPASAGLNFPAGIAIDAAGNLFVSASNDVIRKVTPAGVVTAFAGALNEFGGTDGPVASARFRGPEGLALDASGNLFVADSGNATIRKIDATGNVTTLAGAAPPDGPTFGRDHAIDAAGNIYVASVKPGAVPDSDILKIAPGGAVSTLATGLRIVRGMAVDPQGNLLLVEATGAGSCGVNCTTQIGFVRKISPQGVQTTLQDASGPAPSAAPGIQLNNPGALAVDRLGNVYVAEEFFSGEIKKITSAGVVTTLANNVPVNGMAVDGAGNVIATACTPVAVSVLLSSVSRIAPDGTSVVLAGGASGRADGPLSEASFNCPRGLATDAAGNIYVADTNNSVVRQISPAGIVSTVAGRYDVRGIKPGPLPASLYQPTDLSVDAAGNLYVGSPAAIMKVTFQP